MDGNYYNSSSDYHRSRVVAWSTDGFLIAAPNHRPQLTSDASDSTVHSAGAVEGIPSQVTGNGAFFVSEQSIASSKVLSYDHP